MTPHGRRSLSFGSMIPYLLLLVFATSASAASAVLGIDFGTEYLKAAIARPGSPIEIVLTKDSKRKEAAALAFKPARTQIGDDTAFPERLYGGDALALSARFPTDVYANLKSILGQPASSEGVKTYLNRFPGLRETNFPRLNNTAAGSTVGFRSQSFSKDGTFMVEELLAMEFKNIKANAEATAGKNTYVNEVVITHPGYYTAEEKRAIELAADLAGLKLLGLISDGLAVGLNYATPRTFESISNGGKAEYHLVYDMGAGSTTATVLRFQGRTTKGPGKKNTTFQEVQVMGFGFDRSLGGDALNDLIVDDMVAKFLDMPRMKPFKLSPINVKKHGKSMARLWKDAEKVRQVLSANTVAYASQEGFYYEDVNFKYSLTREEFESLAQAYTARISAPITQALSMADLQIEDLTSIILHGGMIRTPFIQKQLEIAAGDADRIKTNVNADEAAVMGAAFKAASLSPSFRVKDIRSSDISGVPYTMSWSADGKHREQKVFISTSQVGIEKQVTVKALQDIVLEFKQEVQGVFSDVTSIALTNLTKSANELKDKYGCASENITTTFNIRLSALDGTPELASGSVSCKAEKTKDGVLGKAKGLFGFGKKDQEPLKAADDGADSEETPLPVNDPTSSSTIVSAATPTPDASGDTPLSASSATPAKSKPSIITIMLAQEYQTQGLNQSPTKEESTIKQRLAAFDASDRSAVLRAESLNVLEAFTYRARDYLEDDSFIALSTEKARAELEKQLSTISDWLYGDGIDAKIEDFKQRLKGLKAIVDPVLKRREESSSRDAAISALKESISSSSGMLDMIKSQIERNAAEAASKASSVGSSVIEEASSSVSSAASAASVVIGGEDLDEDPYATASSASAVADETELPKPYEYTEEDLTTLSKAYDAAKNWLDEKLALQEKLQPYEDPAVWVADLELQAKKLQQSVSDLIMKQIRMSQAKPKKSKSTKTAKPKTKKSKGSSSAGTETSTSATASSTVKDEL